MDNCLENPIAPLVPYIWHQSFRAAIFQPQTKHTK